MNTTATQIWISRVIGAIDNYNMTETTKEDNLAPMIADLIRETPGELINDVVREISRYAIAKQQEYTKKQTTELAIADAVRTALQDAHDGLWCSSGISTPPISDSAIEDALRTSLGRQSSTPHIGQSDDSPATEERSDDADDDREAEEQSEAETEEDEIKHIGDIQNAYNDMHEMVRNLEPSAVMLKHLEEWPEIAYEVDKWEYMLLHHLVNKCAPLSVIEAVMKENPDALTFEVGDDGYVPLQLAVRHGRSLEVIQAIYKANPLMVQKVSHRGDTAHSLSCKYKRDVSIKVFLYTYRDAAPLPDDEDDDMPGLIPITPPPEKDFLAEYVRSIGLQEAYPVLIILLAWMLMLTMSMLAGVRLMI
jgi:hypothetical protein